MVATKSASSVCARLDESVSNFHPVDAARLYNFHAAKFGRCVLTQWWQLLLVGQAITTATHKIAQIFYKLWTIGGDYPIPAWIIMSSVIETEWLTTAIKKLGLLVLSLFLKPQQIRFLRICNCYSSIN